MARRRTARDADRLWWRSWERSWKYHLANDNHEPGHAPHDPWIPRAWRGPGHGAANQSDHQSERRFWIPGPDPSHYRSECGYWTPGPTGPTSPHPGETGEPREPSAPLGATGVVAHQPVERHDRPHVLRDAQHTGPRPANAWGQGMGCQPKQLDVPLPRPTRAAYLRQGRPLDSIRAPADGHRTQPVAPRPTWTVGPERLARHRSLGRTRTPPRTPGATAAARPLSSLGTKVANPTLGCLVDLRVGRR